MKSMRMIIGMALAIGVAGVQAGTYTWDSTGNSNWGTAASWDSTPTFNNQADLVFYDPVTSKRFTYLGANRTIRKLTFNADVDSNMRIRFTQTGSATARNLTMDHNSGSPVEINSLAGATANIEIGSLGGNLILLDDLQIDHDGSGLLRFTRPMTGAKKVTVVGSGVTVFSAAHTFSGGLEMTGGTKLDIENAAALGSGLFQMRSSTLDNTSGGAISNANNNAMELLTGSFTFTGTDDLHLGTGAVNMRYGSRGVTVAAGTLTFGGPIGQLGATARSLTKNGAGTLTLGGANTFTGGMILNAGTLSIDNADALGAGTFDINGGTLDNTSGGSIAVSDNAMTWDGDFGFTGTADLNLGTGAVTLGATRTVTVDASTLTVGGVIGGGFGLTKDGAGTLTLSGASTYSGDTTISAGTLALGASGTIDNSPTVSLAAGATFDVSAIASYTLSGSSSLSAAGTATAATLTGNAAADSIDLGSRPITLTYDGSNPALTVSDGNLVLNQNSFTINSGSVLADGNYTIVTGAVAAADISYTGPFSAAGTALTGKSGAISITGKAVILTVTTPVNKLVITSVPGSATAGTDFSVTVQVQDGGGTPVNVTQDTGVSLSASGSGSLSGNTATILNGNSSVTLSTVQYTKAESITLTAERTSGDALDTSAPSSSITVDPGAASKLEFSTQPSASTVATVPFATQPVVRILDANDNLVTTGADSTVNVALTLTTGTGSLGGTASMNAVAGVADFVGKGLNINQVGTDKVLTATATVGAGTVDTTTSPALTITAVDLTWLGSPATYNWTTANEVNWSGGSGVYVNGQSANVTFDDTGSDSSPITLAGTLDPISVTVNNPTRNYTFTGGGKISGATGLTKSGAGALTLATANDYSGETDLSGGSTLNINHAEALGTGFFDMNNGNTIDNTSGSAISNANNNAIGLRGTVTFTGSSDLHLSTGALDFFYGSRTFSVAAGNLTVGGQIRQSGAPRSLTKTGAGTLVLSGVSTYSGGTIVSEGTLRLTSTGSFGPGDITVGASGALTVEQNWQTGSALTVADSATATINVGAYDWDIAGLTLGAGALAPGVYTVAELNALSDAVFTGSGTISVGIVRMIVLGTPKDWTDASTWSDNLAAHAGVAYVIPATGNLRSPTITATFPGESLTVEPNGKFQVRSEESSSEVITVDDLIFSGGTGFGVGEFSMLAAGTGSGTTNVLGGVIAHSGYTRVLTYRAYSGGNLFRSLKVQARVDGSGTIQAWEGADSYGGEELIVDNAANTFSGTWQVGAESTLVFNNAGGVGAADIEVLETGTLTILGDWQEFNTLTVADVATVTVNLGAYDWAVDTLMLGGSAVAEDTYTVAELNALGDAVFTGTGTIVVGVPPAILKWATGSDNWTATDVWVNQTPAAATFADGDVVTFEDTESGGSPITVALNSTVMPFSTTFDNSTKTYTVSGTGKISGSGGLTKQGSGTATLATDNDYTGTTTVNGGILDVTGAIATSGDVFIAGSGTLNIGGDVTANRMQVAAGGSLTISNSSAIVTATRNDGGAGIEVQNGASLDFVLDAAGVSPLALNGNATVSLGASSTLTIDGSAYAGGEGTIPLITHSDPAPDTFGSVTIIGFNGMDSEVQSVANAVNLVLVYRDAVALSNPSFEADHGDLADPGYGDITGWDWFPVGVGADRHGVNPDADGDMHFPDNGAIPDQGATAFLQDKGAIGQTLNGLDTSSTYWLQFWYNAREWGAPVEPELKAEFAGATLVDWTLHSPVGGSDPWNFINVIFTPATGSGVLKLHHRFPDGHDNSTLFDAVCVMRRDSDQVPIKNPSFEATGKPFTANGYISRSNDWGIAGWTFTGSAANGGIGVNHHSLPVNANGQHPDGSHVAFLQREYAISQVIDGLLPGQTYELSYAYNARAAQGDPVLKVTIGALTVQDGSVSPVAGSGSYGVAFHTTTYEFSATATSMALKFENTNSADSSALIDDVRLMVVVRPSSTFVFK